MNTRNSCIIPEQRFGTLFDSDLRVDWISMMMNLFWAIVLLVAGLLLLWKCAEFLVAGAVALAERLGVSPLVVGLTVVAMGTSAPEVAASIAAVLQGPKGGDTAIGNVYGSNIANLALVGGLVALLRPLSVQLRVLRREVPVMIGVGLLLLPALLDKHLARPEALVLLGAFAVLVMLTVYFAMRGSAEQAAALADIGNDLGKAEKLAPRPLPLTLLFIAIGLAGLAGGAKMTVEGAVFIGRKAGLSEGVIGLTIVAVGTSLPELVTCVVAALKRHDDVSVGNLVGSNIFNTLLVTATAGLVRPYNVGRRFAGGPDYWIMIAVSVVFPILALLGRRRIGRLGGTLLLGSYFGYLVYLLVFTAAI